MATEQDTALTKSGGAEKSTSRTPLGVWLFVLVLAGLAAYGGYTALHHRQLHADSEMVRKALASDKDRLEASVLSLKDEIKKLKDASSSSEASADQSRADAQAAAAKISELENEISTLKSKVADAVASARESVTKLLNSESALKAAKEVSARFMSENDSLKNQISEAQKKLDAAVSDLTGTPQESQGATTEPLSPLPEPTYP
jgi:chromosome segregation ATPase